MKVTVDIQS